MASVEVFDPAMCCSTGVCGPSVDPALARFAADLEWLAGQGVAVARGDPVPGAGEVHRLCAGSRGSAGPR